MLPTFDVTVRPALAALALASLAACGGGAGAPQAATELPAAALESTAALAAYTATLPPSETALPLDLGGITLPTSDRDEPAKF